MAMIAFAVHFLYFWFLDLCWLFGQVNSDLVIAVLRRRTRFCIFYPEKPGDWWPRRSSECGYREQVSDSIRLRFLCR